jgi:hypothetical protein
MKNHYNDIGKNSKDIVDITIVPEARRDVFIAINKQSNKDLLNKLEQASKIVSQSSKYIEFLSSMEINRDVYKSSILTQYQTHDTCNA